MHPRLEWDRACQSQMVNGREKQVVGVGGAEAMRGDGRGDRCGGRGSGGQINGEEEGEGRCQGEKT